MTDDLDMDYSVDSCAGDAVQMLIKPDREICFGCGELILERYLLKVGRRSWHVHCLRCTACQSALAHHTTCFIREENIYCKIDYSRQFGTKCAKCSRSIQSTDWIRRAKDHVYHLACFACDSCKRQLSTGEEFALHDHRVLCKAHYVELIEGGGDSDSDQASQRSKTKRVRTTFTEEQLQVLQANFQLDSNPDGQDLERIAQITGLSKRVTQVWFQNSRARQKKHQQQNHNNNNNMHNMSMSPESDMQPLPSSSPLSHSNDMVSPISTGQGHTDIDTMFTRMTHSPVSDHCSWQPGKMCKGEVYAS